MKNKRAWVLLSFVGSLVFAASASAETVTWQNDAAHSGAYFQVRFMKLDNIRGSFHKWNVTVQYDPKELSKTSIDATIDATSIDTDLEPRDKDLRGADYFDVDKFPTLTFKSNRVEPAGAGKLTVIGELTLHGVIKEVALDVDGPTPVMKDDKGNMFMGATATTTINRKEFGITVNPGISDDVLITLELDLVRRAAPSGSN